MTVDPLPRPADRSRNYYQAMQELLNEPRYTKLELILIRSDQSDRYTHYAIIIGAIVMSAAWGAQLVLAVNWMGTMLICIGALCVTYLAARHCRRLGLSAAAKFKPLTRKQADWIQQISAGDEHFRTIVARWVEEGAPILQRDYYSLKRLEVLARVRFVAQEN